MDRASGISIDCSWSISKVCCEISSQQKGWQTACDSILRKETGQMRRAKSCRSTNSVLLTCMNWGNTKRPSLNAIWKCTAKSCRTALVCYFPVHFTRTFFNTRIQTSQGLGYKRDHLSFFVLAAQTNPLWSCSRIVSLSGQICSIIFISKLIFYAHRSYIYSQKI